MSFNLSISAARSVAAFSQDGPGCGTPPPGFHPPRPHLLETALHSSRLDMVALNPQPLPPGPGGRQMLDEQCGSVPKHLHFPPPPPPPWTDRIGQAVSFQVLSAIAAGGRQL